MKKLLALTVVLTLCSMASAAVMFELDGPIVANPGDTITVNVISDGVLLSLDAKVTLSGEGTITGAMDADAAGFGWDPVGYPDSAIITATSAEFGGTQFNNNSHAIVGYVNVLYAGGIVVLNLENAFGLNTGDTYDADFNALTFTDSISIVPVPEPATMVILALGGLLLRRK